MPRRPGSQPGRYFVSVLLATLGAVDLVLFLAVLTTATGGQMGLGTGHPAAVAEFRGIGIEAQPTAVVARQ